MARLLIVDDALFMRIMIKRALEGSGHEIIAEGENGRMAIDLYNEHSPDLLLMDITMPDMDGITALKELHAQHPTARVIICSALGQGNKVKDALASGARDFVVKPFTPARLLDAVNKALL